MPVKMQATALRIAVIRDPWMPVNASGWAALASTQPPYPVLTRPADEDSKSTPKSPYLALKSLRKAGVSKSGLPA